jgi:UPF0042 nucleotide-binding protein
MITVTSFGYGHAPAPTAHLTLDVRYVFRDPHVDPAMRDLTGKHPSVITNVMVQPMADVVVYQLAHTAHALVTSLARSNTDLIDVRIAIGCVGGRHRSVVLADKVAEMIRSGGGADYPVTVLHRDLHRPVLARGTGKPPTRAEVEARFDGYVRSHPTVDDD